MSQLDEDFSNEQLNSIGKLLLLGYEHKLAIKDIKRLTRADKVRKVRPKGDMTLDDFVYSMLSNAVRASSLKATSWFDAYFVTGDAATTTLLRMQTDKVYASITLDSTSAKRLHNAAVSMQYIDDAVKALWNAKGRHDELASVFKRLKIKSDLSRRTKSLDVVLKAYAATQRTDQIAFVDNGLKSTW